MVFSWHLASHNAHCKQRRCCTEELKVVFPTDLRSVLQNAGGSEEIGSSPVICITVGNKSWQWKSQFKDPSNMKLDVWHYFLSSTSMVLSSSRSLCLPLSVACERSSSASESWDRAAEHKQVLYTTVSSDCAWSTRGGIPAGDGHGDWKKGR